MSVCTRICVYVCVCVCVCAYHAPEQEQHAKHLEPVEVADRGAEPAIMVHEQRHGQQARHEQHHGDGVTRDLRGKHDQEKPSGAQHTCTRVQHVCVRACVRE